MPWTCENCGYHTEKNLVEPVFCYCWAKQKPDLSAYSEHWVSLHTYRLSPWNPEKAAVWYKQWRDNIPRLHCDCISKWVELEAKHPPDFGSELKFFIWGVVQHNRVNITIDKPVMGIGEARKIYGM